MNENDSEHIAGLLLAAGWEPADSPEESDLLLINTCAVREKPVQKLYSLLGRYAWIKQKRKVRIGVVGCVAQLFRSRLLDRNPSLDFVVGPDQYDQIPRILSGLLPEKAVCTQWSREWKELPAPGIPRKSRVSASMSIMEGCNNFCSYCIVPFTRGREKYRPMDSILQEAHDLAAEGYKEIQLLGQNVNAYRDPGTGKGFPELLRALSGLEGVEWIRFITSHPQDLSLETARAMAESNKVCRQIHLPAQSGSSSVLERMNRKYTRKEYLEKITILRKEMPGISLSTDVIVGFPGETEEEFEETLSLLKTVRFTNIFSFCYSPRPYTAAARMDDSVPREVKKERLARVQALQRSIQEQAHRSLVGQVQKVLCTGRSRKNPRVFSGRNEAHQVVNFLAPEDVEGRFVRVRITRYGPYSLSGELVR